MESAKNKRIAKNTLVLYFRMMVCMLISLYTSRLVLQALGIEDFGINNAVGGFVSMFSIISSSLTGATSRFLSFELGRKNTQRLKETFSASLIIQIIIGIIVFFATETIGLWFLHNKMVIPFERLYAATWVFHCSLLTLLVNFIRTTYNAAIIAHENMAFFAFSNIAEVVLKFLIVAYLAFGASSSDKLIIYVFTWFLITSFIQVVTHIYCRKNYKECRLCLVNDHKLFQELLGFAGWSFLGNIASVLSGQGVNVALNLLFGPVINAARGIGVTVTQVANNFVSNFTTAINPQLTKSYAENDMDSLIKLVFRGSRFSFYIMFLVVLPLLIETEFILDTWLGNYPEHTISFIRLSLVIALIDILSTLLTMGQNAIGRIKKVQIIVGCLNLINLPISYLFIKITSIPEMAYIVALCISVSCLIIRVVIFKNAINLPLRKYFHEVIANIAITIFTSIVLPLSLFFSTPSNWIFSLLVILVSLTNVLLSIFYIGCSNSERGFIRSQAYIRLSQIRIFLKNNHNGH